jgi:imidazolonepropionase-like amidohydrolase
VIALCRCPHAPFSWRLYAAARRAFDDGARRGPLASIAGILFPAMRPAGWVERAERVMIVRAARAFDGERFIAPGLCVVRGDRIVSLQAGDAPYDATVIDIGDATLLPGLIDCHTHVTAFIRKTVYEALPLTPSLVADSTAEAALKALRNATTLLANGFTTLRDVGSFGPGVDVALRDSIDRGLVLGPRMLVAGKSLAITGGHADDNARAPWVHVDEEYEYAVAHGPYGFRERVRKNLKAHVDLIKITATGGVLSHGDAWNAPQFNPDEVAAVTDEAHKFGLRVAAHAHGDPGIALAVHGGCDSIEHCTGVEADTAEAMRERGTVMVPTLWASESIVAQKDGAVHYPPELIEKAQRAIAARDAGLQRALAAGVTIAYGTDCGVFPHEQNNRDFALLESLGMEPADILKTATSNAATLLGKRDRGRLAPGLLADLVAFRGDLGSGVAALADAPAFVMLGGRRIA